MRDTHSNRAAAVQAKSAVQASYEAGPRLGRAYADHGNVKTPATEPSSTTVSGVASAGSVIPDNVLEMEDWEIAPGRIRDESGAFAENVAFSNSFVSST